jgi:glyoxylase-like metal-dependent hydrolase (beta-lactamase superfamily II)
MKPAEEFQQVQPGLFFWQSYAPAVKSDLSSAALQLGEKLVFIDPIPLAPSALEELTSSAIPALIVLTNGNHARASEEFRRRFSIPIAAHSAAETELGLTVDQRLQEGDQLLDGLTVIEVPGAGAGEIALHAPGGVICVGDALIHLPSHGFSLLPPKYCLDPKTLPASLQKLLRFEWQILTFAHGLPLVSGARRKLQTLLE